MDKIVHFYYWENYPTAKVGRIACMSGVSYHLSQSPIIKDVTCKKCLKIIKRKKLKERASWEY
ncbi:MAG: hypothetical protein PHH77_12990 [Victivallaceae bacterium]|nr:hypothetical protein [Victivallaceae bacterium]